MAEQQQQAMIYIDTPENIVNGVKQIVNTRGQAPSKGGRPVLAPEEKKDRVVSIRMTRQMFLKISQEARQNNYLTPGAYILDVLQKKRTHSAFLPYNPDIYRLLFDIEEAINGYKALLERAKQTGDTPTIQQVQSELENFNIFVFDKCSNLVERMRTEFFNQKAKAML